MDNKQSEGQQHTQTRCHRHRCPYWIRVRKPHTGAKVTPVQAGWSCCTHTTKHLACSPAAEPQCSQALQPQLLMRPALLIDTHTHTHTRPENCSTSGQHVSVASCAVLCCRVSACCCVYCLLPACALLVRAGCWSAVEGATACKSNPKVSSVSANSRARNNMHTGRGVQVSSESNSRQRAPPPAVSCASKPATAKAHPHKVCQNISSWCGDRQLSGSQLC